jgi:hypothetical protein
VTKRKRKPAVVEPSDDPLTELYQGQLDDVVAAYVALTPTIRKAKPPNGCSWVVVRDSESVHVAAVKPDGEEHTKVSGEYSNPDKRLWRDPQEVAERLAQAIVFAAALQKISALKDAVKHD